MQWPEGRLECAGDVYRIINRPEGKERSVRKAEPVDLMIGYMGI